MSIYETSDPHTVTVWEMIRDGAVVADVVSFSDGETVTKWRGDYRSLTRWDDWSDAVAIHTHRGSDEGRTTFRLRARIREQSGELREVATA